MEQILRLKLHLVNSLTVILTRLLMSIYIYINSQQKLSITVKQIQSFATNCLN